MESELPQEVATARSGRTTDASLSCGDAPEGEPKRRFWIAEGGRGHDA